MKPDNYRIKTDWKIINHSEELPGGFLEILFVDEEQAQVMEPD